MGVKPITSPFILHLFLKFREGVQRIQELQRLGRDLNVSKPWEDQAMSCAKFTQGFRYKIPLGLNLFEASRCRLQLRPFYGKNCLVYLAAARGKRVTPDFFPKSAGVSRPTLCASRSGVRWLFLSFRSHMPLRGPCFGQRWVCRICHRVFCLILMFSIL